MDLNRLLAVANTGPTNGGKEQGTISGCQPSHISPRCDLTLELDAADAGKSNVTVSYIQPAGGCGETK